MSAITKLSLVDPVFAQRQRALSTEIELLPLSDYDRVIVFFSGKDSLYCLLEMLDQGVDRKKIEVHHHLIDGDTQDHFMDWPVSRDYCRKVAQHLGVNYRESWREGGFKGELLKHNSVSQPIIFTDRDGRHSYPPVRALPNTRRRWPSTSADLKTRWCSPSLKIEVAAKYLIKSTELQSMKVLCVTGERAEESKNRSRYLEKEIHRTNVSDIRNKAGERIGVKRSSARWVDHYRPALKVDEQAVWEKIRRWNIMPHPVYYLGFSRCSCARCIFLNKHSLATLERIDPAGLDRIALMETELDHTIVKGAGVKERAAMGIPYNFDQDIVEVLFSSEFTLPVQPEQPPVSG